MGNKPIKSDLLLQKEEYWNVITHGVGIILSLIGLVFLIIVARDHKTSWGFVAAVVFGVSMVAVYLSSTLYHLAKYKNSPRWKIFRTIDHIAIFYLIAGTYTPFLILVLGDSNGKFILSLIWSIAVFGTLYKLILGARFPKFSLFLYVAMGWLIIFDIREFNALTPSHILTLLLTGGVSYSVGTYFYTRVKLPYNHVIWHVFVLGGSAFHFMAIWNLYCL